MGLKIKIGSRDSALALIQSNWIKARLEAAYTDIQIEIIKIKTQGDKILDTALSKIGDKGLFTKELENELLAGTIDLAVHSMKDLPTQLPEGLEIGATTIREDVRDVVCFSKHIQEFSQIKVIASSSLRRVAQLKHKYPHINFVDMRGNLQTRFRKLDDPENNIDAMILAAAGLKRLGLENRINSYLEPLDILPAVGQGALAIEIKSNRSDIKELLSIVNDPIQELVIKGERAFLHKLEGGCQVPIGIYSQVAGKALTLTGIIAELDGSKVIREELSGELENAEKLGIELAVQLCQKK